MKEKILVIQLRQIGDVVLTTPIARILKEHGPESAVSFLTESPSDQLLQGNPFIDEVLLSRRAGGWPETLRAGLRLRRKRFGTVLDFMANPRSAILAFLSGAPRRISYPVRGRGILYTHRVRPRDGYAADYKKSLLQPLGVESSWNQPEVFLTDAEREWAFTLRCEWLAHGRKRLVTVDPSHRRPTRRWPAGHFGTLCRMLPDALDALPLVLWGPGEEGVADAVVSASSGRALKAPRTSLRQMASLIAVSDLHLGCCSAPRHVAVGVGVPSFTVLGSTSAGWTYPAAQHTHLALGLECQPCNSGNCPRDLACLRDLTPERVCAEVSTWTRAALGWE